MSNTYENRAVLREEDVELVEAFWAWVKAHDDSCLVSFFEGTNKRPECVKLAVDASMAECLDSLMDLFIPAGYDVGCSAYLCDGAVVLDVAELLYLQDVRFNFARGIWCLRPDGLRKVW